MIRIDNEYFLSNDANQWVLNYEKIGDINSKIGKPIVSSSKWYCATLESALKRYLNESPKPSTNITELVKALTNAIKNVIEVKSKI